MAFVTGVSVLPVVGGVDNGLYLFMVPFLDLSHSLGHGAVLFLGEGF